MDIITYLPALFNKKSLFVYKTKNIDAIYENNELELIIKIRQTIARLWIFYVFCEILKKMSPSGSLDTYIGKERLGGRSS